MERLSGSRDLLNSFLRLFKSDSDQEVDPNSTPVVTKSGRIVRSELNLENAVFTVSTFRGKSREVIRIYETEDGKREQKVIIGKTPDGVETGEGWGDANDLLPEDEKPASAEAQSA